MSTAYALAETDLARLPGRRDEDWRWSDLRGLFKSPVEASPALERPVQEGGLFAGLGATEVVIANGRLNWWPDAGGQGAVKVLTHDKPGAPRYAPPMGALAATKATGPAATILRFRQGDNPLALLRVISRAEATGHHARVGVFVEKGVRATLLETYEGEGADYLNNTLIEIYIAEGASLERVVIVDEALRAVSVSSAEVYLKPGAAFAQTVLTCGAKRQRTATFVEHPGAGASVRLDGVYLASGQAHADLTTTVEHVGPGGETSQLTKGAVAGQGRGVFQGRIIVAKGSDQTDARMGHHALILSDRGEVDAKPELLIYADDVSCAHGNTVGALDENALFYARQRGIPELEAKAMLTEAFVGEVIDRVEHEAAREVARAWASDKLKGLAS